MTLAIVSALIEEQVGLRRQLEQAREDHLARRSFVQGQLNKQPVVLALCGIGKVAAATTTALLIERLGVTRILFTGVAGGLHAAAQVGDVVVASELLQHDMNASPIFPRYEVPLTGLSRFPADVAMTQTLQAACAQTLAEDAELLDHLHHYRGDARTPQSHTGLIVSGDQFIQSQAHSDDLRQRLPDALAVEMEGAAVAQVCHDHDVPFAVMRTISDRADAKALGDFLGFVREVASLSSEHMVLRWLAQN